MHATCLFLRARDPDWDNCVDLIGTVCDFRSRNVHHIKFMSIDFLPFLASNRSPGHFYFFFFIVIVRTCQTIIPEFCFEICVARIVSTSSKTGILIDDCRFLTIPIKWPIAFVKQCDAKEAKKILLPTQI